MEFFHAGSAIVLSGHPVPQPHLWLILPDPDPESEQVVAVMVVTVRTHTDKTVVLVAGDHPFIGHDSSADFGGARRFQTARLKAALRAGELLTRVRDGLLRSPRTPHHLIEYCRARFG